MPKNRNYRRRRQEDNEDADEEDSGEKLEETKEMQKFRIKPKGVSAVGLALGHQFDEVQAQIESDPFKLKTGGLIEMDNLKDRNRDREGEDTERSINLEANFAAETNRRDEDTHMLKYIEDEMAQRKGSDDQSGGKNKSPTEDDELYKLPEHIDVRSKIMKSEEMLSNQILSGIPEVDLGIDAKIRNIEETEEARQKMIREQHKKKSNKPTFAPINMASNYMLHSRYLDEHKDMEKERKAAVEAQEKDAVKSKGPVVTGESLGVVKGNKAVPDAVAVAVSSEQDSSRKRTTDKVEKATDDFYYEKFKKRARDSWRYQ